MRLEVENLAARDSSWAHTYALGELDLNEDGARLVSPVETAGRLRRKPAGVSLQGAGKAQVEALCDRCLRAVPFALEFPLEAVYVTLEEYAASEREEVGLDDLGLMVYDGAAIDLDELARGEILLALPSRILCREDCRGLCPLCGAPLNENPCACAETTVDPRWAALKNFKA